MSVIPPGRSPPPKFPKFPGFQELRDKEPPLHKMAELVDMLDRDLSDALTMGLPALSKDKTASEIKAKQEAMIQQMLRQRDGYLAEPQLSGEIRALLALTPQIKFAYQSTSRQQLAAPHWLLKIDCANGAQVTQPIGHNANYAEWAVVVSSMLETQAYVQRQLSER